MIGEYVVGFDGSKGTVRGRADSTALVKLPVARPAVPSVLGYWSDDGTDGWQPPRDKISEMVEAVLADPMCVAAGFDPTFWSDEVAKWEAEYGPGLRTRYLALTPKWRGRAWGLLKEGIELGVIQFDPGADDYDLFREHVLSIREQDFQIGKEHTGRTAGLVDVAAALSYACSARLEAIEQSLKPRSEPAPRWPNRITRKYKGVSTTTPRNVACVNPFCDNQTGKYFCSEEHLSQYRSWWPTDPRLTRRGKLVGPPREEAVDRVEAMYGRQRAGPPTRVVHDERGSYLVPDSRAASDHWPLNRRSRFLT